MAAERPAPSVTVVVPATDRPPTLGRCIAAVEGGNDPPEELIVVTEPSGAGPATARNAGAVRASGEVLVFVDSDVVVRGDALSLIRSAFTDPGLTATFGSYDDSPEAPDAVSGFRNLLHHHVHQSSGGRASTFWAGLGAIRRTAFLEAGGFDDRSYRDASIEDIELGARLAAGGARIELEPGLQGTHLKAWTVREMVGTDFARRAVPWVELVLERRTGTRALNLGWRNRLSVAAAVLAIGGAVTRHRRSALAGALSLLALNSSFYGLLLRRRGPAQATAGFLLHMLHLAVGALAVPVGLAAYLARGREVSGG